MRTTYGIRARAGGLALLALACGKAIAADPTSNIALGGMTSAEWTKMTPAQKGAYLFQRGSYINQQVYAAEQLINRGDYASAIAILKPFIDSGESDRAAYDLGLLYAGGKGVPQDMSQARVYMEKISDRYRLARDWLVAQGDSRGQARVWSVSAKAIESTDHSTNADAMQRNCPDMRDASVVRFWVELGDTLLHQYGDRHLALLQYQTAEEHGSPEAAGRIAALNSQPPESSYVRNGGSSESVSDNSNMPQVCTEAAEASDRAVEDSRDHQVMGQCIIAMTACMVTQLKDDGAVRECVARMMGVKK